MNEFILDLIDAPGTKLRVSKRDADELLRRGRFNRHFGFPPWAVHYRARVPLGGCMHLIESCRGWTLHYDAHDPRDEPLRHMFGEALPETIATGALALGAIGLLRIMIR